MESKYTLSLKQKRNTKRLEIDVHLFFFKKEVLTQVALECLIYFLLVSFVMKST